MDRLFFLMLLAATSLYAGPPFLTDDPDPGILGQHELYFFSNLFTSTLPIEEPYLNAPAIEADWTPFPNFIVQLIVPYAWAEPNSHAARGPGDLVAGLKYRFLEETPNRPQAAFAPQFYLPTGNAERGLGNGRLWYQLPLWIQKSWGPWTSYGGGGWAFNPAPGMTHYPFAGWVGQRDLNDKLTLGLELFGQGALSEAGSPSLILNAGGYYHLTDSFDFLFTAGHSLVGQERVVGYLGFYWTDRGGILY